VKKFNWLGIVVITILVITFALSSKVLLPATIKPAEAFGYPGACPTWSPSTLTFLGTASNPTSKVWFTGFNGILGEVFYPSVDKPATVDWQFLVGDARHTWVDEEKKDTTSQVTLNDARSRSPEAFPKGTVRVSEAAPKELARSLSWDITNTSKNGLYQIQKTIFTDPNRNTLIQQVTFTALEGTLSNFNLYTLYHPAIDNEGQATTGYSTTYNGKKMLMAKNSTSGHASALASSLAFKAGMMSSGFVGHSDGWQDLKGGMADSTMNWTYESATNGNIAQMAMFDLSPYANSKSVTFNLVLGFGNNDTEAESVAAETLGDNFSTMLSTYNAQWNNYTNSLNSFGGMADQQYYVAAMAIKAATDKTTGAIVAGLGNPWGNSNYSICTPFGIPMQGGYHLVWPRDLYKIASALIVAGDTATASKSLDWLLTTMQQPDGHFLQNAFVDGTPYWTGIQMDETALPIVLAWKLGRTDAATYIKHIKPAADYIVKNGPVTGQERWEENSGYSPGTIAAEIAGLVCAADIARVNGDTTSEANYLATADYWQNKVESWTFTTSGSIGDGQYFERIDDNGNPNDGHLLQIRNGGGVYDERSIVDSSFLELVRLGVKPWNNPYILSSLKAIDSTIKQTIPGKGDGFFRYNHDGYGETSTGADYTGAGVGRLWPIFTGERGHFAIAKRCCKAQIASGEKADPYLATMRAFANSSYMIPEQVWDNNAPPGDSPGTPTKSMTPLSWSMAEYITLLASSYSGQVMDQPAIVKERYATSSSTPLVASYY